MDCYASDFHLMRNTYVTQSTEDNPVLEELQRSRKREAQLAVRGVLCGQPVVQPVMRRVLVEWLAEVAAEFVLGQATLLRAVSYLDRFLACRPVHQARSVQLLGVVCLWVAAKLEEACAPSATEMLEVTDHSFTPAELLASEASLLEALQFELSPPTALHFLHMYLELLEDVPAPVARMACCLLELACLEPCEQPLLPSRVAGAALCGVLAAAGRTELVPRLVGLVAWDDHAALARTAQSLYATFTSLAASSMNNQQMHPMIARYAASQRAHGVFGAAAGAVATSTADSIAAGTGPGITATVVSAPSAGLSPAVSGSSFGANNHAGELH